MYIAGHFLEFSWENLQCLQNAFAAVIWIIQHKRTIRKKEVLFINCEVFLLISYIWILLRLKKFVWKKETELSFLWFQYQTVPHALIEDHFERNRLKNSRNTLIWTPTLPFCSTKAPFNSTTESYCKYLHYKFSHF